MYRRSYQYLIWPPVIVVTWWCGVHEQYDHDIGRSGLNSLQLMSAIPQSSQTILTALLRNAALMLRPSYGGGGATVLENQVVINIVNRAYTPRSPRWRVLNQPAGLFAPGSNRRGPEILVFSGSIPAPGCSPTAR